MSKKVASELLKMAKSLVANRSGEQVPVRFIITKNKISVSTPSTSWVNVERKEFSDDMIDSALAKMKKVRVLARENGVKLKNFSKRVSELKGLMSDFNSEVREYNKKFDELLRLWERIEKQEDMFYIPLSDLGKRIPELDKATNVRNEIDKMFYRSRTLSDVGEIDRRLDEALRDLSRSDAGDYTMMAI